MANHVHVDARGMSNLLDQMAVKIWGQLESDAYHEFWRNAKPVDMSDYLEAETTMVPHMMYDGVTTTAQGGRGMLEAQYHLMLNQNDVLVASAPKTGTTWVQEIVYNLMHQEDIDKPLAEAIDIRVPYIEFPECGFKGLQSRPSPRLLKTHLPYQMLPNGNCNKQYKIIYCTRNPKDTVVSLYHFYKMIDAFQFNGTLKEFLNVFWDGKTLFGPFEDNVLSYWNQRHRDNVIVVKYEDLQKEFLPEVRRIAKFLGIEVDETLLSKISVRCGFEQMSTNPKSNHSQWTDIENVAVKAKLAFMRKGKVGDWKNHFDEETNNKFDQWIANRFGRSDITFDYEI